MDFGIQRTQIRMQIHSVGCSATDAARYLDITGVYTAEDFLSVHKNLHEEKCPMNSVRSTTVSTLGYK